MKFQNFDSNLDKNQVNKILRKALKEGRLMGRKVYHDIYDGGGEPIQTPDAEFMPVQYLDGVTPEGVFTISKSQLKASYCAFYTVEGDTIKASLFYGDVKEEFKVLAPESSEAKTEEAAPVEQQNEPTTQEIVSRLEVLLIFAETKLSNRLDTFRVLDPSDVKHFGLRMEINSLNDEIKTLRAAMGRLIEQGGH